MEEEDIGHIRIPELSDNYNENYPVLLPSAISFITQTGIDRPVVVQCAHVVVKNGGRTKDELIVPRIKNVLDAETYREVSALCVLLCVCPSMCRILVPHGAIVLFTSRKRGAYVQFWNPLIHFFRPLHLQLVIEGHYALESLNELQVFELEKSNLVVDVAKGKFFNLIPFPLQLHIGNGGN